MPTSSITRNFVITGKDKVEVTESGSETADRPKRDQGFDDESKEV